MTRTINFDMDGTIANLYGVDGWLESIIAKDVTPYTNAKPLVNMAILARHLNKLINKGYTVNIISWLAKHSNAEYDKAVTKAKIEWLKKHLPSVHFTNIYIVAYGTPKQTLANGILFDDEEPNRKAWGEKAYNATEIMETLKGLM